ncbi:major facilitator superfamily domain-containing protein [Sporodiniella umbellata]|nr:major facilitator superfamily domain-containing protein [Sporodiniella umbellata]
MLTYSIIVPIMPFAINAIEHGISPDNNSNAYDTNIENPGNVSQKSGVLLALFSVGIIVGSLGFGYLVGDRLKHRRGLMLVGILGLLGSTLLFMLGEKYWELLLARFLQGFSSSSVWTLGMCLVSDTFALEELGTQMGRITMFHTVGLVSGAPIGAPFIFCIAIAGLDFLLRLFLVERKNNPPEWFEKDSKNQESIVSQDTKNDSTEDVTIFTETVSKNDEKTTKNVTYWSLLKEHRLLAGMLMVFTDALIIGVFETTLSLRLVSEWGYNSSKIGLVFIAEVGPTFIGSPISGIITDKYGPKILVYPTWIVCAITTALCGIPNQSTIGGIAPLIVLLIIQGFCISCFMTPVLAEIGYIIDGQNSDGTDDGQSKGYALINIAFAGGGIVGPLLGGYLYSKIGFFYLCIVMGCSLFICSPYIFYFVGGKGFHLKKKLN